MYYDYEIGATVNEIDFDNISMSNLGRFFAIDNVLFAPVSSLDKNSGIPLAGEPATTNWGSPCCMAVDDGIRGYHIDTNRETKSSDHMTCHRCRRFNPDDLDSLKEAIAEIRDYSRVKRVGVVRL